jgi:pimeloyl-ACP methyl ester carboxylesterase
MPGSSLLVFLILLAILLSGLLIAGQVARQVLVKRFPPPGAMLELQGYRLHVRCEGQGPVTVLLVAGLNDFSLQWSRLQPMLSQVTKTCSYDRAGLGWSDPSPKPPKIDSSVTDLHAVVQSMGGQAPLIFVGHSYGSLLVRMYVQRYPQNVKAMILLDPANEFMAERIPGYTEALDSAVARFRRLALLTSLGLAALSTRSIPANQLQGEALRQYRAIIAARSFCKAAAAETAEMVENLQAMQAHSETAVATVPVVIISRGQPERIPGLPDRGADALEQTWSALQTDLVERLNASQIIAEQSGHNIQLGQPDLVYDCITQFIPIEE